MAKDFSFDITSDFDHQELVNAIDQAQREIGTRYDFKGSDADIKEEGKDTLIVNVEDDYKLGAVIDILQSKMIKRNLSLKILDLSKQAENAAGGTLRKNIPLKRGLKQEDAKAITKKIRENYPKVKATIQGEEIRVSSTKKDELQGVMTLLKEADFDFPLQFGNYR
ncbi:TPA: YajQ family cyclic di-GMP-binding protein [candidate division CPR2 bacterium]|uniref:Nucleotide-binding protein UU65_C0002G0118 n=1 Tax=candidate division CPR2 bacterium GW2011_GWC1_41_48 TaxID=1618344 RepID=A0A0G0W8N5_UNCC2|nr:MAG: hypothetical protein UT47_C0002G0186 [candidate division CPR2 bacterium GW2011_GWC2_39_35]KKR28544.1 MAG: hypothetical protein UT60_C0018G0014 [candidate division CPR2 bacterium GW2011_GWD2_39_7]KKS09340.1 MAG: hypothetical protein UU65_C0002G0118 [candidate division CPR2 bacterium GW2011_GWC1_41_48]OGB72816.1 MAG: YajQ family cyclic di-GMP-binding protein [candidate division CPR2 bacterium GWD2_39_7]HBG82096.1 YajQ family cyclic di-GMP-binding protein [candidate division CPR2 bacterium